jgi:hypothetical protein
VIELDGFTHDRWITTEVTLPEFVAQHCDGLWILAIGHISRHDVPAQEGRQSQELEVGSRQLIHDHVVGYVTTRNRLVRIVGGNHVFDGVRLPQLANLRSSQPHVSSRPALSVIQTSAIRSIPE